MLALENTYNGTRELNLIQRNVTKLIMYTGSHKGIFIHFFYGRHSNRNKKIYKLTNLFTFIFSRSYLSSEKQSINPN